MVACKLPEDHPVKCYLEEVDLGPSCLASWGCVLCVSGALRANFIFLTIMYDRVLQGVGCSVVAPVNIEGSTWDKYRASTHKDVTDPETLMEYRNTHCLT